ncbi:hypothetical protein BD324DRAFT_648546 [Kockovaella imperatae]|uniref:Methyltransferase domain-containing protein n=1 Tax=Kockovaella imperatae TaxID=4999 RepID=A0A1Y1UPF9_9TREE|nr:hypothetical protein BD324DRAFT_648546 [Kockovaella imperatae]ORX39928.1 hypothetical protein BD324DRAFT_648546 [Kockovaella imperatae]
MHGRLGTSLDEKRDKVHDPYVSAAPSRPPPSQASPRVDTRTTISSAQDETLYASSLQSTVSSGAGSGSGPGPRSRTNRERVLGLVQQDDTTALATGSKLFLPPNVAEILPCGKQFAAWQTTVPATEPNCEISKGGGEVNHGGNNGGGGDGGVGGVGGTWQGTKKVTHSLYRGVYRVGWEREVLDLEARMHESLAELVGGHTFARPDTSPKTVLDLGTGSGHWCISQASVWTEADFIGVDVVPCQQALTGRLSSLAHRITWSQADFLTSLPYDAGVFDYVHIRFVGLGVPEPKWGDLLEEATRVLAKGGTLEIVEMAYTLGTTSHPSLINSFASLLLADLIQPFPSHPIKFYLPTIGMSPTPCFEQSWDHAPGAIGDAVMTWVRSALDYKGTALVKDRGNERLLGALSKADEDKWVRADDMPSGGASLTAWAIIKR